MKKMFAVFSVLMFSAFTQVHAFDWFGGRLSIGGGYGRAYPQMPNDFEEGFNRGPIWTGHVKYFINDNLSFVAQYADLRVESDAGGQELVFRPATGNMRFNLFKGLPISPYLTAGAGVARNRNSNFTAGTERKWTTLALQGGGGLEVFITESTSLGAEALYHNFVAEDHKKPYRLVSAVGTLNLYFGAGPSTQKAREDADRARADAEQARQQAAAAQQQQQATQGQLTQAQLAAQSSEQARLAAERQAQEMQARTSEAQAEMDRIRQMVASKQTSPVTFKTGSAELLVNSHETLNKVAEAVKKYPDLKLRVEGHTDAVGAEATNLRLSQRRAESVRNYLVSSAGVAADQVVPAGFGESQPVTANDTAEGRAQNRRVEFIFFIK